MWKTVEARESGSGLLQALLPGNSRGTIDELIVLGLIAVFLAALAVMSVVRRRSGGRRSNGTTASKSYSTSKRFRPTSYANAKQNSLADPAYQQSIVRQAEFRKRPLLNREEYRVFEAVERACHDLNRGFRVMAQVSLGEVIRAEAKEPTLERDAHASINSKRLDIAVIDREGYLAAAIEYQGTGHHLQNAFMRDAVKREALRKAGLNMIEVLPSDDADHIRWMLLRQIAPEQTAETA